MIGGLHRLAKALSDGATRREALRLASRTLSGALLAAGLLPSSAAEGMAAHSGGARGRCPNGRRERDRSRASERRNRRRRRIKRKRGHSGNDGGGQELECLAANQDCNSCSECCSRVCCGLQPSQEGYQGRCWDRPCDVPVDFC